MLRRHVLAFIPILLVWAGGVAPAGAVTTGASGYGVATTSIFGEESVLYVSIGACDASCPPGIVAAGGGRGAGHVSIAVYSANPDHSFAADVTPTRADVDGSAYPRMFEAPGIGSDGRTKRPARDGTADIL